jgi:hypothetical protein
VEATIISPVRRNGAKPKPKATEADGAGEKTPEEQHV